MMANIHLRPPSTQIQALPVKNDIALVQVQTIDVTPTITITPYTQPKNLALLRMITTTKTRLKTKPSIQNVMKTITTHPPHSASTFTSSPTRRPCIPHRRRNDPALRTGRTHPSQVPVWHDIIFVVDCFYDAALSTWYCLRCVSGDGEVVAGCFGGCLGVSLV